MVSEASATNRPFSVIELKKSGPPPSRPGEETFTATAIRTGTRGQHQQPGQVAAAPEDQPQLGAQEPGRTARRGRAYGDRSLSR